MWKLLTITILVGCSTATSDPPANIPCNVWCAGGACQSGRVSTGFDPSFSQSHCGSLPLPDGAALTGPNGGAETMTVYTCQ